jgi:hypothetical protein
MATSTKTMIFKPSRMRYVALAFSLMFVFLIVALYQQNRIEPIMAFVILMSIVFALLALLSGNLVLENGRLTRFTWFGYTVKSINTKDIEAYFEVSGYSKMYGIVYFLFLITPNGKFVISSAQYTEYDKLKRLLVGRLSEATELKRRYKWRQLQGTAFFFIACAVAIFCWLFFSPEYHAQMAFLKVGFLMLGLGFLMLPINAYLYGTWNRKKK